MLTIESLSSVGAQRAGLPAGELFVWTGSGISAVSTLGAFDTPAVKSKYQDFSNIFKIADTYLKVLDRVTKLEDSATALTDSSVSKTAFTALNETVANLTNVQGDLDKRLKSQISTSQRLSKNLSSVRQNLTSLGDALKSLTSDTAVFIDQAQSYDLRLKKLEVSGGFAARLTALESKFSAFESTFDNVAQEAGDAASSLKTIATQYEQMKVTLDAINTSYNAIKQQVANL